MMGQRFLSEADPSGRADVKAGYVEGDGSFVSQSIPPCVCVHMFLCEGLLS